MKDLIRILKLSDKKGQRLTVAVAFLIIFAEIVGLVIPWIFKNIIDTLVDISSGKISVDTATDNMMMSVIYLAILFGVNIAVHLIEGYLGYQWFVYMAMYIKKAAFAHLNRLSLDYFEKQSTGKIKERVDKGIWEMQEVVDNVFMQIAPHAIVILVSAGILFYVNPYAGLMTFAGMPLFIWLSVKNTRVLNEKQNKIRDAQETASGIITASIVGVKTVKSFNNESKELADFSKELDNSYGLDMERNVIRTRLNFYRFIITNTTQLMVISYISYLAIKGYMTAGDIFLFFAYIQRVYSPLWQLTYIYDRTQEKMQSVRRVFELFDTLPLVQDTPEATVLGRVKGALRFKNVSFGYGEKKVLNNISFDIEPGQMVALVGPSGSGKSTLAKLVLRLYDIDKGQILIDEKDISKVTQKSLRKNVGVVLQDSVLFNSSVLENIRYGRGKATKSDVINASKVSNSHTFIEGLKNGYNTIVGERGVKLSGGEQQRINIARSVLKDAPILILDEATSHLDSESEKLVQDALAKMIKGKTTLVIAHRLSTVMQADKIIVLKKGRIVETGTHKELLKKDGLYSKFFKIQSGAMLPRDDNLELD